MHSNHPDISSFIAELSAIPLSDPLVDLDEQVRKAIRLDSAGPEPFTLEPGNLLQAILKIAAENRKESGLDTLCIAREIVCWNYKEKAVRSPLFLVPVITEKRKGSTEVRFKTDEESVFLNPFLKYNFFGDQLPADLGQQESDEQVRLLCAELHAPIIDEEFLGNFHHHRYALLREMEQLQQQELNPLVQTILGNESAADDKKLELTPGFLTPADPDQLQVFRSLEKENVVVHGPPGTGKSQVLTNIIGKRLSFPGMTLVVSEKKSALEVLVAKLNKSALGHLCFLTHSQVKPKDFIARLRQNWQLLEEEKTVVLPNLFLSEQLYDQLQLVLNKLRSPSLVGGISFGAFNKLGIDPIARFFSGSPSLEAWLAYLPVLETLQGLICENGVFKQFKAELLLDEAPDVRIRVLQEDLNSVCSTYAIDTFGDLERLRGKLARIQLLENSSVKAWFDFHEDAKKQKQFLKAYQRYQLVSDKVELLEKEQSVWKKVPVQSEVRSWLTMLTATGWRTRRKKARLSKEFLLDEATDLLVAAKHLAELFEWKDERTELDNKFRLWGIHNPAVELNSILYVIEKLAAEDPNELNELKRIKGQELEEWLFHADRLKQLERDLANYTYLKADSKLELNTSEQGVADMVRFRNELLLLPKHFFSLLAEVDSLEEAHALVVSSNWTKTVGNFPELRDFDASRLTSLLGEILQYEDEEYTYIANKIRSDQKQQFDEYAFLLRTPSAKLSAAEKERKKQLKAGKAILVKEFAKTKQHMSIRQLLGSEARLWIELLTPVWLSTPAQMAAFFPMEKELFQLVIFDEASQVPLPNALGSLQRSRRAVIAGDEQQMSPSHYFTSAVSSVDLLHQAAYYWNNTQLRHHYRSVHPALIEFSNRHFYNNELLAFPSPGAAFPLYRHFVDNGVYIDRANREEAKAVAAFLETADWKKHIGITAFSEQQLEAIRLACSEKVRTKIAEGVEKDTVFFKPVELVQGDECDTLVISMGYGKNEAGDFHLRFGPLNQATGHKRLNVLLTRAREELHFFTSVTAAEIPLSKNESVNLLRSFMTQLEGDSFHRQVVLPHGLTAAVTGNELVVPDFYEHFTDAREMGSFTRVMRARGWKVLFG